MWIETPPRGPGLPPRVFPLLFFDGRQGLYAYVETPLWGPGLPPRPFCLTPNRGVWCTHVHPPRRAPQQWTQNVAAPLGCWTHRPNSLRRSLTILKQILHLRGANLLNNPSTVHRWTPKSLHWQWQLDSVAMVAHGLTRSGRGFYRRGFFERSLSACPFRARSRCQSSASADRRVGIAVTTIRGPHARGPRKLLLDSEGSVRLFSPAKVLSPTSRRRFVQGSSD